MTITGFYSGFITIPAEHAEAAAIAVTNRPPITADPDPTDFPALLASRFASDYGVTEDETVYNLYGSALPGEWLPGLLTALAPYAAARFECVDRDMVVQSIGISEGSVFTSAAKVTYGAGDVPKPVAPQPITRETVTDAIAAAIQAETVPPTSVLDVLLSEDTRYADGEVIVGAADPNPELDELRDVDAEWIGEARVFAAERVRALTDLLGVWADIDKSIPEGAVWPVVTHPTIPAAAVIGHAVEVTGETIREVRRDTLYQLLGDGWRLLRAVHDEPRRIALPPANQGEPRHIGLLRDWFRGARGTDGTD